ncbi:hypothetical protein [Flammeovirga sp. OC4]|uniref:hypothetical protein n=1 Tax=Flammeovirga sp. OC4 TaxID=1382345 RepID=UPI0005C54590|nr:hypothetical protein [Flammeovirga sp. OC4]
MVTTPSELKTTRNTLFDCLYKDEYTKVYFIQEKNLLVCEALQEYIPIEDFKKVFHFITLNFSLFDQVDKFLFDKQSLRVFHQPSMEWYFVFWKREMFEEYGLVNHVKILPQNLPWFEASVKAGRAQIEEKYKDLVIDKLNIEYVSSIEEIV